MHASAKEGSFSVALRPDGHRHRGICRRRATEIRVLATDAAGATGAAVYYPWAGTPLPTLSGFLQSATATDETSTPVQLPTELRHCATA